MVGENSPLLKISNYIRQMVLIVVDTSRFPITPMKWPKVLGLCLCALRNFIFRLIAVPISFFFSIDT